MWGCQKVAVINRTILLSICTNIIFIGGWSWLSTVLLTCMQCGCDYVSCKMLFCLEIIRCFVFYVCLVHEGALFKPKQHHTSHWISYRLSYSASSSCDSEFVFGAWDLDCTPIAFTSAPEKVITTNILSTREFCTCTERIECFVGMLWKLFLMLLALKFLLSHYLECWESPKLAFKWTPGMDAPPRGEGGFLAPPHKNDQNCD